MRVSWSFLPFAAAAALLTLRAETMSVAPDQVDAGEPDADEPDADDDGGVPDADLPDVGADAEPTP